jgi:hypothetical protein
MGRKPSGDSELPLALRAAKNANSADELRVALAVALPLQCGISLKETALILGRTPAWIAKYRRRFIVTQTSTRASIKTDGHGGRRNEIMPLEAEEEFMERVCLAYVKGTRGWHSSLTSNPTNTAMHRMKFADHVRSALVNLTNRSVSLATAYNLMTRVGRKKFEGYTHYSWSMHCTKLNNS